MSELRREGERFRPQPIPSEIAERFVAGNVLEGLPVEFENEKEIVRRLFCGGEQYSGISGATLYLDHHHKKEKKPKSFDNSLHFDLATHPVFDGPRVLLAQMHFDVVNPDEFRLIHRYVHGDKREGVGTQLFQIAERWFLEVVRVSQRPVVLSLQTGQKSVIRWVEKMGFSVVEDHQELRRELDEHPERFFEDEVFVSEESRMQGIVKDPYIFPVGAENRYMDGAAVRLTFTKKIQPRVKDSS